MSLLSRSRRGIERISSKTFFSFHGDKSAVCTFRWNAFLSSLLFFNLMYFVGLCLVKVIIKMFEHFTRCSHCSKFENMFVFMLNLVWTSCLRGAGRTSMYRAEGYQYLSFLLRIDINPQMLPNACIDERWITVPELRPWLHIRSQRKVWNFTWLKILDMQFARWLRFSEVLGILPGQQETRNKLLKQFTRVHDRQTSDPSLCAVVLFFHSSWISGAHALVRFKLCDKHHK